MGLFSAAKLFGMTIRESATDGSDFTNPDADYRRLFLGEDGALHLKDSSGTVTDVAGTGGTDLNPGTSFPVGPSTNDLCFRTDRGILYYYDGTRWLSVTLYAQSASGADAVTPLSVNGNAGRWPVWSSSYDVWLVNMRWTSLVNTTNSGSAYWTATLAKVDGASATSIVTPTTAADSPDVYVTHTTAIGALLGTANDVLKVDLSKTNSPGSIYFHAMLEYRLVG